MSKRAIGRTAIALLLIAILGGAYLIVVRNSPALNASTGATPAGVFH